MSIEKCPICGNEVRSWLMGDDGEWSECGCENCHLVVWVDGDDEEAAIRLWNATVAKLKGEGK